MGHGHSHSHQPDRSASKRALKIALLLTGSFTVAEVIGGLLSGSLALLADAGHMLSDSGSLGLALFAVWLAGRPPTPRRSFGYQRAEILAALANGVTLVVIAAWILYEASQRLTNPTEVLGGPMLAVAVIGLGVNLAAMRVLGGGEGESLNMRAARLHVLADLAGSIGAIVAAAVVLGTGWERADPIVGALIGLLILGSAVPIMRSAGRVLLEQAPEGTDPAEIGEALVAADGVLEIHDLHLWEITSGFPALSAHVIVGADDDCHRCRLELERILRDRFEITHTTLQVDHRSPRLLEIGGLDSRKN